MMMMMMMLWKELREIWRKHGDPIRLGPILDELLLPLLICRKGSYYYVYDPAKDEVMRFKRKREVLDLPEREAWIVRRGKIEKVPLYLLKKIKV